MTHYALLTRFNAWANERIYDCVAALPEAEYRKDRKAFFGSIHNTLNHLLVVDRVWLGRLEAGDPGIRSLDQILHDDFGDLRAARETEDGRLIALVEGLSEAQLESPTAFHDMAGQARETRTDLILVTLVNHQTHHRGQVHCMLTQAGIIPPPLDIPNFTGAFK